MARSDPKRRNGSEGQYNVVDIIGGLGNQLFQFAFGEGLAQHTGVQTLYDLSAFESYVKHGGFAIERTFDITLPRWTDGDRSMPMTSLMSEPAKRLLRRFPDLARVLPGIQPDDDRFRFDQPPPDMTPTYFLGTWQSQPYDVAFLAGLAEKLSFRPEIVAAGEACIESLGIDIQTGTAIHIRMGDFLTKQRKFHLPLAEQYYTKIIFDLLKNSESERFYVFSDEIDRIAGSWFAGLPVEFVQSYDGASSASDLYLMSRFRNIVISASTFGWWAGALSQRRTKVLYPVPWVRDSHVSIDRYTPFIPQGWIPKDAADMDLEGHGPTRRFFN